MAPTKEGQPVTLAAKMAAIMGDLPTMIKNGQNVQQKYQYVTAEDVKAAIRPLLKKHKVALFAEMYGFPLTIYLLSSWLGSNYPGIDLLSHDSGHLLSTIFGWQGDPHFSPFHLLSYVLIGGGFLLIATAWEVLYKAQREHRLATDGPYARLRHPQYVGFVLITLGFLLQWPTLITLLMFPILIVMYIRLARREEQEAIAEFGDAYNAYMKSVPAFFPHLRNVLTTED